MKEKHDEITIKELIDIFIPKIWVIALVAVVCAALLGGYSMFIKDDTYTSTASFIMVKTPTRYDQDAGTTAITTGLSASEISAMQSMISMAEQIMKTNQYLMEVKNGLIVLDERYKDISIEHLRSVLSVEVVGEATVFDLSAETTDAQLSLDIAAVVYKTFPDVIRDYYEEYSITIKTIDPPLKATDANSKGTLRNAVIGGLAGAVLSMLVVFIISKLDIVIRTKEKLEQSFDIPVIGLIPRFESDN